MPLIIVQGRIVSERIFRWNLHHAEKWCKGSLPTRYPSVLVIDLDGIDQAPMEAKSGRIRRCTGSLDAPVDWYLAYRVGMNYTYK